MAAKGIDWQKYVEIHGRKDKADLVIWAYEQAGSYGAAVRFLGGSMSQETFRNAYREVTGKQVKQHDYHKYPSQREERSHHKQTNGGRKCTYPGCHKSTGVNYFFCPAHHDQISRHSGMVDSLGGEYVSHGRHGRMA